MCARSERCSAYSSASAWTTYRARGKRGAPSRSVFHPRWSMCRCVRKTMSISSSRTPRASSCAGRLALLLRGPVPQPWRADARVDEDRHALRADQVRDAGQPPRIAFEERRIALAVRLPVSERDAGVGLDVVAEEPDRVGDRFDLDRADYHRTRGGAGSWCASCHEITGFRSTPIFSISHSMTSPGLR